MYGSSPAPYRGIQKFTETKSRYLTLPQFQQFIVVYGRLEQFTAVYGSSITPGYITVNSSHLYS